MEIQNIEIGIPQATIPEKTPPTETTVEKIQKEIRKTQEILKTPLELDYLWINYSQGHSNDWVAKSECYLNGRIRVGSIYTGENLSPDANAKFLQSSPSSIQLSMFSHELTHLVINETVYSEKRPVKWPFNIIMAEGISTCVEIQSLNSHLPENEKINPEEIGNHCQRIIEEKKDYFINPEKIFGSNITKEPTGAYWPAIHSPYRLEYDGFNTKRDFMHIAGINFGLAVLKDEICKWPILFRNPPAMEEIIQPQKYIDRVSARIKNFQVKEIQPTYPILVQSNSELPKVKLVKYKNED